MEQILDQELNYDSAKDVTYGSFWPRFWAAFIDGIIVSLVQIPILIVSLRSFKSPWIIILLTLVALLYKPVLEFAYQATLGKKLLGLKVVNSEFQKGSLSTILLRNSLQVAAGLLSIAVTTPLLFKDGFASVSSFLEYSAYISVEKTVTYVSYIPMIIALIDVICLLTDMQKRTLHDRIGKTFVVKG